jgi:DUF2924 family protein
MDLGVVQAIEELRGLTIADLQTRYRKIFGEEARCSNKQFLFRRIAWQLQAAVEGDLSERVRRRAAGIADDADIRAREPANYPPPPSPLVRSPLQSLRPRRDSRLPPPGTLLARRFQGSEVVVKVLDEGFEYQARRYRSLSAIAREVTGTRWNGLLFFGVTGRRHG